MSERAVWVTLALVLALLVWALRFLSVAGFSNDHYMHLAAAQQMTFGEWPSRDFVDIGMPLMVALSALALWTVPQAPMLGEAVLVAVMFGLAAVLTLDGGRRLTGSVWLALLAVGLEIAIFPRSYSYPKVLAYAAGFVAMWRYVGRPSVLRLAQMALVIVLSFLLRYDHGLYLGVGALATVIIASSNRGARESGRQSVIFAVVVIALLLPYLVWVQVYDGLWHHVLRGNELRIIEDSRGRRLPDFGFALNLLEMNAVPWLYYLFHLLPFAAALVAYQRWRRSPDRRELAMVVPLAVVAVLANVGLIRETLSARIPDAIVPACLLLVWLVARAPRLRPSPTGILAWAAVAVVVVVTAASVTVVGTTKEQLERAEMLDGFGRLQKQFHDRTAQFRARLSPDQIPSRAAHTLLPFFAYADRCLGPRDHILTPAFLPEVIVWSRRPFAGGQVFFQTGVWANQHDRQLVMDRLPAQRVPVVVLNRFADDVTMQFGELGRYVHDRFTEVTALDGGDGLRIRVGFDPRLAIGRDGSTGWPCYR
ncbi:MAG TPA: hypothetical protein VI485_32245 [Vicinamibacterales bacterium]|nr:hypothetical protein [Vicinamibacterales bacterium]